MRDTKEYILQTSLKLFFKKGYKDVTMKDIVVATGLSKGAFYHYFSSKEQVFADVIKHFFASIMHVDYNAFPQTSLKEFYHAVIVDMKQNKDTMESSFMADDTTNNYHLIFDAVRLLPDFKQKQIQQKEIELNAWTKITETAIKNKEVVTKMSAMQLAKLFIYLGDGYYINFLLGATNSKPENELTQLWEGIYNEIKA